MLVFLVMAGSLGCSIGILLRVINRPLPRPPLPEAIIGKWAATGGNGYSIEFAPNRLVILSRKGIFSIRGRYSFLSSDAIEIEIVPPERDERSPTWLEDRVLTATLSLEEDILHVTIRRWGHSGKYVRQS
jgi:hypothetical protein